MSRHFYTDPHSIQPQPRASLSTFFWVWRSRLVTQRHSEATSGFILPTVVFMLLIMSLVVSVLVFRTFSRTTEVSEQRQQRILYNAATPAIDRGKAKLEYLFEEKNLADVPTDAEIQGELAVPVTGSDLFTIPSDESRIDINNDGTLDNAWTYTVDTDGDGTAETRVMYSILHNSTAVDLESDNTTKADALVVRNGPIDLNSASRPNCPDPNLSIYQGWEPTQSSSALRKAFQVHAVAYNTNTGSAATLEMQQDRQSNFGNKWGAWFLYDLEINTNSTFNWNGAMHTEGSFFFNNDFDEPGGAGDVNLFLATNSNSCVYTADASTISMAEVFDVTNTGTYQGQLLIGRTKDNGTTGSVDIDPFVNAGTPTRATLDRAEDSVLTDGDTNYTPADVALDPIELTIFGTQQSIFNYTPFDQARDATLWPDPETDTASTSADTESLLSSDRILNEEEPTPFVDDTYRADNRWGPKPVYGEDRSIPMGGAAGTDITGADVVTLTRDAPAVVTDEEEYGLDGYWERRARAQGLRIIVGQRLELGNRYGWEGYNASTANNDPLYPLTSGDDTIIGTSTMSIRRGELLQWRTLRDNLAAVQATALYHYNFDPDYPIACLASTTHPGTTQTIVNSKVFNVRTDDSTKPRVNFLAGEGTNGWEFQPPDKGTFTLEMDNTSGPWWRALNNLAYFAGDPAGGAPSFPVTQERGGTQIYPDPYFSMWGDFSNLRRVLAQLAAGTAYDDLSTADKSTLHTAACTLGMLAYGLEQDLAEAKAAAGSLDTNIGQAIAQMIDSNPSNGDINELFTDATFPEGTTNPYYGTTVENPGNGASYDSYAGWTDANTSTVIEDITNPGTYVCAPGVDTTGFQYACDINEYLAGFSAEQLVAAGKLNQSNAAKSIEFETDITLISKGFQIPRDRALGFLAGRPPNKFGGGSTVTWDASTGLAEPTNLAGGDNPSIQLGCDPNILSDLASGGGGASSRDAIALTLMVCGQDLEVRYPSLYYLFPYFDHDYNGANDSAVTGIGFDNTQPVTESYISHTYIGNNNPADAINDRDTDNRGEIFQVIDDDGSNNLYEESTEDSAAKIALTPRAVDFSDWLIPVATYGTAPTSQAQLASNTFSNGISFNNGSTDAYRRVAVIDTAFFNGREHMSIRALTLDLDLMRRTPYQIDTSGQSHWLPLPNLTSTGTIIYGFREDAAREDNIVRPYSNTFADAAAAWTGCSTLTTLTTTAACLMNFQAGAPQDPPLNNTNSLSPKSVDFYPDPARRPYGFRLTNGADLRRLNNATAIADNQRGFTFITDNAAYIQGDFNRHTSDGSNILQEFTNALTANWSNFYAGNPQRNTVNSNFANETVDYWRPAEILADAITFLSSSFTPGSISDGITQNEDVTEGATTRHSYRALNEPYLDSNADGDRDNGENPANAWIREDGTTTSTTLPIRISRRGLPLHNAATSTTREWGYNSTGAPNEQFKTFSESHGNIGGGTTFLTNSAYGQINEVPANTYINAMIVQGIVPARTGQSYGTLVNFPRFIEKWRIGNTAQNLHFAGSMFQLSFSSSSTGPFDHDAWEPGQVPLAGGVTNNQERVLYYGAPTRQWGFDIGLLYAPPGVAARRLTNRSNTRSEFYREVAIDDPYIANLLCAEDSSGNNIMDTTRLPVTCP